MAAVIADTDTKDVHAALEAWARWAHSALKAIGWPEASLLSRVIEMGVHGAVRSAGMRLVEVDQMCEMMDRAILRLDKTEKEVIARTYMYREATQVTATKCGLTYQYYRQVLSRSRRRIADYLAGQRVRLV